MKRQKNFQKINSCKISQSVVQNIQKYISTISMMYTRNIYAPNIHNGSGKKVQNIFVVVNGTCQSVGQSVSHAFSFSIHLLPLPNLLLSLTDHPQQGLPYIRSLAQWTFTNHSYLCFIRVVSLLGFKTCRCLVRAYDSPS